MNQQFSVDEEMDTKHVSYTLNQDTRNPTTLNPDTLNPNTLNPLKKKKKSYNSVMAELLKPPPKEDKPNIHLSGGGQFSKLDKI